MRAKHFLLLLLTFFCCRCLIAMPNINNPDSLINMLSRPVDDTAKALAAFSLCEYYHNHQDDTKAESYFKKGVNYAQHNPMWKDIGAYYHGMLVENNDLSRAEQIYLDAEKKLRNYNNATAYYYRAVCWYNYGVLQQFNDDQKGFINIVLNRALPLAQKSGDAIFIGKIYWGLGVVFKNTLQYDHSETNLKKAISIFTKEKAIYPYLLEAYTTIAETYILEKKHLQADSALKEAYTYLTKVNSEASEDIWVDYYTARGMLYTVLKDYSNSIINIQKGISIAKKIGDDYKKGRLIMQLFYAYFEGQNYPMAINTLDTMSLDTIMMVQIVNRLQIYDGYAACYSKIGNYKNAYEWQKKYAVLSDSVHESQLQNDISAMELKFKTSEKEKQIVSLVSAQNEAKLTTKNKNNLILLLSIICGLLIVVTWLVWNSFNKSKKLNKQRELVHWHTLNQKEKELQLESVRSLLEGEENERSRIARDLHDGLGGMLASIKLKLSHIAKENNWNVEHNELAKITIPIDNTLEELRRISRNIVSPTLLRFGLEAAINDLCQSYSLKNTKIEFQSFGIDKNIQEQDQLMIYRIVQELLANALKHAKATHIMLQCSQNNKLFLITIEDNGIGFDKHVPNVKGIGLINIENRVNYMSGTMEVNTAVNNGTTFNIELKLS